MSGFIGWFEVNNSGSRLLDFLVAVGAAGVAVLARLALSRWLGDTHLYVFPLFAVVFVAWYSGFWPAVLALTVSMLGTLCFFALPRGSFILEGTSAQLGLALFFGVGFACAILGEAQRAARRRAAAALADSLRRQDELSEEIQRRATAEAELLHANSDLRASEERFRTLSEAMPLLVWTADRSGEITYFNRRWLEYTGLPLEQGRHDGWRQVIHPDDVEGLAENWATAIRTGESASYEGRIRRHNDGEYRWHLSSAVPLHDADGGIVGWIGAASDVDAQKRQAEHLERLVRQRTAKLLQEIEERTRAEKLVEAVMMELRRSNRELEQFAYVASHDLQEPLRKIQAFGDRLEAKCRDQLDEQGQDYVHRMQGSAARMQLLINDLLTYSRVSTRAQEFTEVDLSAVARDVISDLEARILQTGGAVRIGDLPTWRADPLQMRQLIQNLIGNALKFGREGVPPVVEIRASVEGDVCRLEVSDNGIGFEERYLDRIFQVFQRLHGRGVYEGTGVGLAICKKIVERHGGSITARSIPGEGSTFVVTLPIQQRMKDEG